VQRLLESTETDHPYDIRDRAILLLLAVYGMRIGEIRRIRLCDVDCRHPRRNKRKQNFGKDKT
jgi:integrase